MNNALLIRAQALVESIDIGQRHAIVVDHNDDVTALCGAAFIASRSEQAENLRLVCETLFALGYRAGQEDDFDLSDL